MAWSELMRSPRSGGGRVAKRQSVGALLGAFGVRAVVAAAFVTLACVTIGLVVLVFALIAHSGAEEPPAGERA